MALTGPLGKRTRFLHNPRTTKFPRKQLTSCVLPAGVLVLAGKLGNCNIPRQSVSDPLLLKKLLSRPSSGVVPSSIGGADFEDEAIRR